MSFSDKLMEQRKKYGFSQEQLAEKMGVSRQAVSRWETENTLPDAYNLKKISELFHVSIDYLLAEGTCSQEEKRDGAENGQMTQKDSAYKKSMFWSIFLITLGVLGILTLYILSTQIPAIVMRPEPVMSNTVQIETNIMAQNTEVLYSPQKVYSFFPFLDSHHLKGVAAGFVCLVIMGFILLTYNMREKVSGILKTHILPKKKVVSDSL